jgi:hypothetical protein
MIATDTGALGETTKWNVLSAGSRSAPARTVPRTLASGTVNGAKVTDVDARGAIDTVFDSISRPSTDSTTGTLATGWSPLFETPAVTATRSCPEKADRAKVTEGTETLDVSDMVVSVMPSGNRASSALPQPPFWKSLIKTASRRLSADCPRMLSASFSAGPNRVASELTFAASIAASSRARSDVARMFSSAFRPNSTSVALSSAVRPATTRWAASRAFCQ